MPPDEIERIFLSATVLDCGTYRTDLKAYVENNTDGVKIDLQKHWAGGAADVVSACKAKFNAQDAYLGLFGRRYGWVPAGFKPDSITRLEWRWAVERWKAEREPPIFIFRPRKGEKAFVDLEQLADDAFDRETPPASPSMRADSRAAQEQFMAEVDAWANVAGGRIMEFFVTREQLQQKAAKAVNCWNLRLLRQARQGARPGADQIPAAELGRIGREDDFWRLQQTLDVLDAGTGGTALALAVHGDEGHGQLEFAEALRQWTYWEDCEVPALRSVTQCDASTLARWACERLRNPVATGDPMAQLADTLAARLKLRHVVLVLGSMGPDADRWQRFVLDFWQPLRAALAQRGMPAAGGRRLLLAVIDHQPAPVADTTLFWDGAHDDTRIDTHRVLALPAFASISAAQVRQWLQQIRRDYPDQFTPALDEARRKAIAAYATTPNGLPALVYQRLQRHGFWAL